MACFLRFVSSCAHRVFVFFFYVLLFPRCRVSFFNVHPPCLYFVEGCFPSDQTDVGLMCARGSSLRDIGAFIG